MLATVRIGLATVVIAQVACSVHATGVDAGSVRDAGNFDGGEDLIGSDAGDGADGIPFDLAMSGPPWIAFVSDRTGDFEIHLVHRDGSNLHVVASSPSDELAPNWSPDGSRLAFMSNRGGAFEIYTVDVTTDVVMPLVTGLIGGTTPAYSPDGATIVFANAAGLHAVASGGGVATALTSGGFRDNGPAWSADGTTIYFASDRSGGFEVWSVQADGTGLAQVTTGSGILGGPALSPDGTELAFSNGASTPKVSRFVLASLMTTTLSMAGDYEPAYSRTGDEVAVTSIRYAANNPEIVLLDLAGIAAPVRLTTSVGIDGQATFQPRP